MLSKEFGVSQKECLALLYSTYSVEERKVRSSTRMTYLAKLQPRGKLHSCWKGGRSLDSAGYWIILKPTWFTGYSKSVKVPEHVVLYCQANGLTELPKGYVVHHKDLDKQNNVLSNLVLMTNQEHSSLHKKLYWRNNNAISTN